VSFLTGITDEMVAGQRIDETAVSSFVEDAVIVVAHNAAFDRKFAERYWPIFEDKAWGCSASEIEWRRHGFAGAALGYLLNGAGFFHQAHRAVDDCHALLEVLAFELPTVGRRPFRSCSKRPGRRRCGSGRSSSSSRMRSSLHRYAHSSGVATRWSDGSDGQPRSWYIDITEDQLEGEIGFLRAEIYLRDVEPRIQAFTALSRFSARGAES
jgi:DNA polymerase III subunit epsilon